MNDARPSRRTLSATGLAWRGCVGVAALVAAYLAATQSLANAVESVRPDQAFALAPWDAQIAGRYARTLILTTPDAAHTEQADRIARQALRREGTASNAIATLGLDAQARGDTPLAQRYLDIAQRLSRRDVAVQLWAIEDAVGRGDIAAAVTHYDIALRASHDTRQLLFPVLASAIADPAIAGPMTRLLATQRPYWTADFIFFLAGKAPDPGVAASFFDRLDAARIPISDAARSVLITSLVAKGEVDRAWQIYATRHPTADRRRSRDARFANVQDSRSPFDWQLFGDNGLSTSIERGTTGNVLAFSVPPGAGGLLARQMEILPPGSYRLRSSTSDITAPASVRPMWVVTCQDGRPIGRIGIAGAPGTGDVATDRFDVPADCRAQYLSLVAPPSDIDVTGNILAIEVVPAS